MAVARNTFISLIVIVVSFALFLTLTEQFRVKDIPVLPVETWVKIGEEKQVFNKKAGSGLVRRYYADPSQEYGVGSTLSVFYKDRTEELFWRSWNLYTADARYALKFKGKFVLQSAPRPLTSNMVTLGALTQFIKDSGMSIDDPQFNFVSFPICLMDEKGSYLVSKEYVGEKVCFQINFWKE